MPRQIISMPKAHCEGFFSSLKKRCRQELQEFAKVSIYLVCSYILSFFLLPLQFMIPLSHDPFLLHWIKKHRYLIKLIIYNAKEVHCMPWSKEPLCKGEQILLTASPGKFYRQTPKKFSAQRELEPFQHCGAVCTKYVTAAKNTVPLCIAGYNRYNKYNVNSLCVIIS